MLTADPDSGLVAVPENPFSSCKPTQEFFLLILGILPIAVKSVKVHIVAHQRGSKPSHSDVDPELGQGHIIP
jgi:hypothetical protein